MLVVLFAYARRSTVSWLYNFFLLGRLVTASLENPVMYSYGKTPFCFSSFSWSSERSLNWSVSVPNWSSPNVLTLITRGSSVLSRDVTVVPILGHFLLLLAPLVHPDDSEPRAAGVAVVRLSVSFFVRFAHYHRLRVSKYFIHLSHVLDEGLRE